MASTNESEERLRVAFFGALIALAAIDGHIDREELARIFELLEPGRMGDEAYRNVLGYLSEPPNFLACIKRIQTATPEEGKALMTALVDVALADDLLHPNEQAALDQAQRVLRITDGEREKVEGFVRAVKRVRERGIENRTAIESLKRSAAGAASVGVPIAAVSALGVGSGAVVVTSGLAALALGAGMIPGIGVAVLLGVATHKAVNSILDTGNTKKKRTIQAERERLAQLVIRILQNAMEHLISRIDGLEKSAATAEANREAIQILVQRLHALRQALAKRQAEATGEP